MEIIRTITMNMLRGMVGNIPDYKVRQYALAYYEKEFITADDLAEIEALFTSVGGDE